MNNPCSIHPCDGCALCSSGQCCGEGVVDMALPLEGSWPEPLCAPLGVLVEVDGAVKCHACGWVGDYLSRHVHEHGMTADQYRAYFGLNAGHALMSAVARGRYANAGHAYPESLAAWNAAATPEQRALVYWDRDRRSESRALNPRFSPDRQRAFALVRAAGLKADPARLRVLSIRCRLARRTEEPGRMCSECGALFCSWTPSKSATCLAPECVTSARRRAAETRWGQMNNETAEDRPEPVTLDGGERDRP